MSRVIRSDIATENYHLTLTATEHFSLFWMIVLVSPLFQPKRIYISVALRLFTDKVVTY